MTIVGMTTDPYDGMYGYAVIFYKLFNYMIKSYPDLNFLLLSNDGQASTTVKNDNFQQIHLDTRASKAHKIYLLTMFFIKKGNKQPADTVFIVNTEIPELIAGNILKVLGRDVHCVVHDMQLRSSGLSAKVLYKLRYALIKNIGRCMFVNSYTASQFKNLKQSTYVGNPIF